MIKIGIVAIAVVCLLIGNIETFPQEQRGNRLGLKHFVTSEERIRSHGYPAESHFVETEDGYVLNLFRIPFSPKLKNSNEKRPVILLQHGLFSNSDCWLANGPDHALAYLLADQGFDVWLGNARGNIYSRQNTQMSLKNPYFWHFSWHEIGVNDIPAMIDYILEQTGEVALHYAGHSQGTTVYFVMLSMLPQYNAKIKTAHMLAPCVFFGHGSSFIFKLMTPLVGTPGSPTTVLLENIEFIPYNRQVNRIVDTACGEYEPVLGKKGCDNMFLWLANGGYQNTNMSALQVLLETHPAGCASNQGIHYIQLYNSHEFRQYDYGAKRNMRVYEQSTPPDYDLGQITAQTYLYTGANDALCPDTDVDKLVSKMPQLYEDYRIPDPSWNHLDFIDANQVKTVINDRVVNAAVEYERNKI